jgi:hypothetical protein
MAATFASCLARVASSTSNFITPSAVSAGAVSPSSIKPRERVLRSFEPPAAPEAFRLAPCSLFRTIRAPDARLIDAARLAPAATGFDHARIVGSYVDPDQPQSRPFGLTLLPLSIWFMAGHTSAFGPGDIDRLPGKIPLDRSLRRISAHLIGNLDGPAAK